ncbi:beta-glucosidase [Verrucomicrobium sp. GAS474]|uniref:GDSL-type esterase/lipase family protein n=1 Tax=Verrucomicrobium sp. GAS474 TaxID=1882831 RepID=UPI00087942A6|nr:GDSL-type esterase/lipase family protein [Verrucomicrobium sp. GAS474]SDU05489.1 beta-glucosidase [Verrucomicrobium sp. GAS474]
MNRPLQSTLLLWSSSLVLAAWSLSPLTAAAQDAPAAAPAPTIGTGPAPASSPSEAAWGYWPGFKAAWEQTHNIFVERAKKGDIEILFLGDSITAGWLKPGGKEIWDKYYAPLHAEDFGIGGDSTRQVLWRIDHGTLDGITPKVVVLMIGINNMWGDNNKGTNTEIAAGIKTVVEKIEEKLPNTKILLLGMLPCQNSYFCGRVKATNAMTAKLDGGQVRYFDMFDKFAAEDGKKPIAELYIPDGTHLNAAGYQVWHDTMDPVLTDLLK